MPEINSMQANLGLIAAQGSVVGLQTPTPAETSLRLMSQATQQRMVAQQTTMAASVGAQYRQQLAQIQSQQSLNPYGAQMAASYTPGAQQYSQGYLPSPLAMTPPSTGVFRPPMPSPMSSITPMQRPPIPFSVFQPQMPAPMFQSEYDQQAQLSDMRANQMFSYGSQAPGVLAQGAGLAAGAYAGARMGAKFGRYGRIAGAIGGAALAGYSGVAGGLRDFAQSFTRPMVESRMMGAGIQNMSRDWVVSGPQLHEMGMGLSRNASIQMAEEVKDLAGEDTFQEQTGDMFNRKDLMKVMQKGGQAGLFDMAQTIPQIKQQLRETSTTIRQFMELTNNPDVTSVIRDMGRLRQFGLTQNEMVVAAQGMKAYSRAAGTTIGGLQQIGGLPGAATFQQAGLSAGTGFQYGNFAAASARQFAASGGITSRQLSLLGGVQGMAQRDIQAQAAFSSMPMYSAMNAQYGAGGWGVNKGVQGQYGQGAFGMVQRSMQALNQGVQQGGLGALAAFPLMQRQIADEAASNLTPEQQMAQRFGMAMNTGKRLGLKDEGAFAAGSRMLYGDEVAEQMLMQAKSPQFWDAQRQQLGQRQRELSYATRQRVEEESPLWGGAVRDTGRLLEQYTGFGREAGRIYRDVSRAADVIGEEFDSADTSVFTDIGNAFSDRAALKDRGVYRRRRGRSQGGIAQGLRRAKGSALSALTDADFSGVQVDGGLSGAALVNAENLATGGGLKWGATIAQGLTAPFMFAGDVFGADPDVGAVVAGLSASISTAGMSDADKSSMVGDYIQQVSTTLEYIDRAKKVGGIEKNVTNATMAIENAIGGDAGKGEGLNILQRAGDKLDKLVYDRGKYGQSVVDEDYRDVLQQALKEKGVSASEARRITASLMAKPEVRSELGTQLTHYAKTQSRDPSAWLKAQEQDPRTALYDQLSEQATSRVEGLKAAQTSIEETLGVGESRWKSWLGGTVGATWIGAALGGPLGAALGMSGIGTGYSSEEVEVQGVATEMGADKFAMTAAGLEAFTGDKRDRTKWERLVKQKGLTTKQALAEEKRIRAFAGKDQDVAERIREMSTRGTTQELGQYATGMQARGMQEAFSSQGFMESLGQYSSTLERYMSKTEGVVTAGGVAGQFTDEELSRMEKAGGAQGRAYAKMLRQAKGGDREAQGDLLRFAQSRSKMTAEGVEDVQTTKAEGEEARRVETSKEAVESMAAMFKDFAPATKDFKEGAEMLRDAMEAGQILASRED